MKLAVIAAAFLVFVALPQEISAETRNLIFRTSPGETIKLGSRSPFNRNCQVTRLEPYKMTKGASLGKLRIVQEKVLIERVSRASLNHCLGKRLPGVAVYFTAGGRRGKDTFSFYRVTRGERVRFNVTVVID